MTITLTDGRFWALTWLVRRNARQIAIGTNTMNNITYWYFRDNSCVSISESTIVIMPFQKDKIVYKKVA